MNDSKWTTIDTIDSIPNQRVQRSYDWIKMESLFPEYRIHVESHHLGQYIDKGIDEIANKSGMKAKRFTIIIHYDIPIPVLIQKFDNKNNLLKEGD